MERQSGKIPGHAWVWTDPPSRHVWGFVLFVGWLLLLCFLTRSSNWDEAPRLAYLAGTLGTGLLAGWNLAWFFKLWRSPLAPHLYVTTLYLVETAFQTLRWWPIWNIRDLCITDHHRGGLYLHTKLTISFADSNTSFELTPKEDVERLLARLRDRDETIRAEAAASNWDFFAANDDFRGDPQSASDEPLPSYRRAGFLVGAVVSLFAYGGVAAWNSARTSANGPPSADQRLPNPTRAGAELIEKGDQPPVLAPVPPLRPPSIAALRDLPNNGALHMYSSRRAVAPLEVHTRGSRHHYFIKLVDAVSDDPILTVFVRGGHFVRTEVPLGVMKLRYAAGAEWYGDELLFGPDTSYAEIEDLFEFARIDGRVTGYSVELFLQPNGNLREKELRADQW